MGAYLATAPQPEPVGIEVTGPTSKKQREGHVLAFPTTHTLITDE